MKQERPKSSCVYNHFDEVTLEPLNSETAARLLELRFDSLSLRGKNVLDIGCNNGYWSMIAAKMGAKSIKALDVQDELLAYVKKLCKDRAVTNIEVSKEDFKTLDPANYRADVVFFLEVLHWVVSQGLSVPAAIEKLASLTTDIALVEFPWSVDEPSIKAQTTLTAEQYNAGFILDELSKNFRNVEIVNFNSYFKGQKGSQRVLLIAKQPKRTRFLKKWFPGIGRIETDVANSQITLSCDDRSIYAVKRIRANSPVLELPIDALRAIFTAFSSLKGVQVVAPEYRGEQYVFDNGGSEKHLVYPWVGPLPLAFLMREASPTESEVVSVAVEATVALRSAYGSSLQATSAKSIEALSSRFLQRLAASTAGDARLSVPERLREAVGSEHLSKIDRGHLSYCHGDIHTGNVVRQGNRLLLVDLENVNVNSAFFDVLWSMVMTGVTDAELIKDATRRTVAVIGRPVAPFDLLCLHDAFGRWVRAAAQRATDERLKVVSSRCGAALEAVTAQYFVS